MVGSSGHLVPEKLTGLWICLFLTGILFFMVQGSDPGYCISDTSLEVLDRRTRGDDIDIDGDAPLLENAARSTEDDAFDDPEGDDLLGNDDVRLDFDPNEEEDARAAGVSSASRIPIRSKYCRHSRRMVPTFDHFCAFLGTCIGEKNRCRFWWFLFFQTITFAKGLIIIHSGFHDTRAEVGLWLSYNGHALAAAVVMWIFFVSVGSLFLLHTFLAMANMTSYEFMRSDKVWYLAGTRDFDLPFSTGALSNLKFFCFSDALCTRPMADGSWEPRKWPPVGEIERESEDLWNNLWENKYWACC